MFIEATDQEWIVLYDVAKVTKSLKPWLYLDENLIIAIEIPGREDPCFFIVSGQAPENIALALYPCKKSLAKYTDYIMNTTEDESFQSKWDQNYLLCYFCDRNEMLSMQINKLKDLGLSFRGRNEWIQFVSVRPGYAPYMLDKNEVNLMSKCLSELNVFIGDCIKEKVNTKSSKENVIFRCFDKSTNEYTYKKKTLAISKESEYLAVAENENLINALKKLPATDSEMELDLVYLESVIKDKTLDRPAITRLAVLGENTSEMILGFKVVLPVKDPAHEIYDLLMQSIIERGRPRIIYCKREICYSILSDFCDRIDIQLEKRKSLCIVDNLVSAI